MVDKMDDRYVSGSAVLAGVLWMLAGLCLGGSWAAWALGGSVVPHLLMGTAVMLSLGALVAHMRRMTGRICALVRATRRTSDHGDGDLRSVR